MGEALVNILKGAPQTNAYAVGRASDLQEDFSLRHVHDALTHASTTQKSLLTSTTPKRNLVTSIWHAALAERP